MTSSLLHRKWIHTDLLNFLRYNKQPVLNHFVQIINVFDRSRKRKSNKENDINYDNINTNNIHNNIHSFLVHLSDGSNYILTHLTAKSIALYNINYDIPIPQILGAFLQLKKGVFLYSALRNKFMLQVEEFEYLGNESNFSGNPVDVNCMNAVRWYIKSCDVDWGYDMVCSKKNIICDKEDSVNDNIYINNHDCNSNTITTQSNITISTINNTVHNRYDNFPFNNITIQSNNNTLMMYNPQLSLKIRNILISYFNNQINRNKMFNGSSVIELDDNCYYVIESSDNENIGHKYEFKYNANNNISMIDDSNIITDCSIVNEISVNDNNDITVNDDNHIVNDINDESQNKRMRIDIPIINDPQCNYTIVAIGSTDSSIMYDAVISKETIKKDEASEQTVKELNNENWRFRLQKLDIEIRRKSGEYDKVIFGYKVYKEVEW